MESSSTYNAPGLYRDPESGQYTGAINEIQADAIVHAGWKLVKAADPGLDDLSIQRQVEEMSRDENVEKLSADGAVDSDTPTDPEGGQTYDPKAKKESK